MSASALQLLVPLALCTIGPPATTYARPRPGAGALAVSLERGVGGAPQRRAVRREVTGYNGDVPGHRRSRWMETPGAAEPDAAARADERELSAVRAGDEAAFLALVERYHGAMLRVASVYVRSRASAEEVVQDAWVGVLRGLPGFEGRSSLRSWVFQILVNCAKTRGARDGRFVPLSSLAGATGDGGPSVSPDRFLEDGERWAGHWSEPPEPWPDARVASGELVALVRDAIETLPAPQRTVMTLRDVHGWDSTEVCELLGISEGNQRVLLHRARSRVRALVQARLAREERP